MASEKPSNAPIICVVGFHHARGPEIEAWFGVPPGTDPAVDNDWSMLPFMALSDGAHTSTEDFSYFTLRQNLPAPAPAEPFETSDTSTAAPSDAPPPSSKAAPPTPSPPVARSLFGLSCTRQLDARELRVRPRDVTRSTVQKSVVVLAPRAGGLAAWREKLGLVTRAWFMQRDFTDTEILKDFQESLAASEQELDEEQDQFLGLSLREFIHEFKYQALVLFKCCLLQPKMLFFGSRCERLCMVQFAIISLIPGLIRRLEDCADPELDSCEKSMTMPSTLKTSDRNSLLAYMGLPLQVFGKGSLFGPYTPLQQLDVLADSDTKSYIVGSTNSLLLQQKDRYSDIIVNLDDVTLTINSPSLRSALNLTVADRRWIDSLLQTILQTWDPADPARPRHHGYLGSEDFLRLQFEEYVLALLAATKYHDYLYATPHDRRDLAAFADIEGDPAVDFGDTWLAAWQATRNHALWQKATDPHLFDLVEPRHPSAGAFSIDDLTRRFQQQVSDLRLDERLAGSREQLGKHWASGREKVSSAFTGLMTELEARRAAHAQRRTEQRTSTSPRTSLDHAPRSPELGILPSPSAFAAPDTPASAVSASSADGRSPTANPRGPRRSTSQFFENAAALRAKAPDLSGAQAAVGAAGQRAGAYLSSWGAWANERRRGWGGSSGGGGGGGGGSHGDRNGGGASPVSPGAAAAAAMAMRRHDSLPAASAEDEKAAVGKRGSVGSVTRVEALEAKSPPTSPLRGSPRKGASRGKVREERGSDGIGRLDA